jgi:hypothetical protein
VEYERMTDLTDPYWVIRYLEVGESVPGETFTVFVADREDGDGYQLDLQCMMAEPTAQDVGLELDSYCIVNEGGGVHYGGLEEVTLLPDRFILRFRDDAVEELDLPSNVVHLGIGSQIDIDEMRSGLRRVLTYGNPEKIPSMNL